MTEPSLVRIPGPIVRARTLLTAKLLIAAACVITIVSVQWLTAVTLSLFLIFGQAFIVMGVLLALGVAVTDLFRRRGVSQVHFEAGETIFRQGDPGDVVYSILAGEVVVVREEEDGKERVLTAMGAGEYFGEMALISEEPRTATVRAITEVDAMTMGRADFTTLYAYMPGLRERVEELMKKRQDRDRRDSDR